MSNDKINHWKLMFPNDFLGAPDLQGADQFVTIKCIQFEELKGEKGRTDNKYCMYFNETPKKLVLNKTNAKIISEIHGDDTNMWVGKQVSLYPTTTKFGRKTVDCIRIRAVNHKPKMQG